MRIKITVAEDRYCVPYLSALAHARDDVTSLKCKINGGKFENYDPLSITTNHGLGGMGPRKSVSLEIFINLAEYVFIEIHGKREIVKINIIMVESY